MVGLQEHGLADFPIPQWPLDVAETQAVLASYAVTARWAKNVGGAGVAGEGMLFNTAHAVDAQA